MAPLFAPVRLLLLGLLIFGILAKPVLAIACEIHDATRAVAEVSQADELIGAVSEPGREEGCCALPDCSDCCAHSVALLPAFAVLRSEPAVAPALRALSVEFEPAALAAVFRPPIAV